MSRLRFRWLSAAAVVLLSVAWTSEAPGQEVSKFERDRARMMLNIIRKDLMKYYYDEAFHGLSLDDAFNTANERIDQAKSVSQLFAGIARPLIQLDDSHTFFIPPGRSARIHFGWQMKMIGDRCHITAIQEGSDAEKKGLKRGDVVLEVDGRKPARQNLWGMYYVHRILAPRTSLPLLIQSPGGAPRKVEVEARVEERKRVTRLTDAIDLGDFMREGDDAAYLSRHRIQEVGEQLVIWKMPQFDMTVDEVRTEMNRIRKWPSLILDLRDNGGGAVETMQAMVGVFAGEKTKIGDVKGREPQQPIVAK
ncbi:MAG TPA: S41 family peptidase, partial [Candidatus Polarisedimenticolia bacterium]|nr:S41 family peptidase [Candidatus Polarisedimenticolia bacterium]